MTPQDEQTIRTWGVQQKNTLNLVLASDREHTADQQLALFCDQLQALVPAVEIRRNVADGFRTPALILGRHRTSPIRPFRRKRS